MGDNKMNKKQLFTVFGIAFVVVLIAFGANALNDRLKYLEAHPEVGKINCTYSEPEKHCYKYAYRSNAEVACERNQWDFYRNESQCIGKDCNGLLCSYKIYGPNMIR
jgi:hypothetical protein